LWTWHEVTALYSSNNSDSNNKPITDTVPYMKTLREEYRLRLFENRVLRRIFGSKRDVTGGWRKLHNEELHDLYSLPNIIRIIKSRRVRWAGHVA
jgi:hypothetical protein